MNKLSIAVAASISLSAQSVSAIDYMTAECEQALALSALPSQMRAGASIYVLTADGFAKTIESTGPFTCIVQRNHPKSLIPQCLDQQGAELLIPAIIHKTNMALSGASAADIQTDFQARAASGEFKAPDQLGVNYMMSHYNYIYLQGPGRVVRIPPHLMHYAPNVTDEDIGAADDAPQKGMPHINDQGIHGYYISFVEDPSDFSDVQSACAGQVGDFPPS